MEIAEFAFSVTASLLANIIQSITKDSTLDYFQKKRLNSRIEDVISLVIEPIVINLRMEGISEAKQIILMEVCSEELKPLSENSSPLFKGSLNGQKIFDELYKDAHLPDRIVQADLNETYTIMFPRIATLLCKIPVAVKDWESNAWAENFKRLDEIGVELQNIFYKVDALTTSNSSHKSTILTTVRRALVQRLAIQLDLTGLRGEKPIAGKFDDFFVHPQIQLILVKYSRFSEDYILNTKKESFSRYSGHNNKAIIYGEPGAGKSTWSQWFQRSLLENKGSGLPVRQELRSLDIENLPSMQQLIRNVAGIHYSEEITTEVIKKWIELKQLIFILDGIDEIHESKREKIIEWIEELCLASNNSPILITSRPLITDHLDKLALAGWLKWKLLPFDKKRITDYMERWYKNTPLTMNESEQIDTDSVAAKWRSDPTIKPLTGNPLLLSTLLMVHHLDGQLPTGRAKLYQRYVEGLLGTWDGRRKIKANKLKLSLEVKKQILRNFALQLQYINEEILEEEKTIKVIQKSLDELGIQCDAKETLNFLRERSGLIIGPGTYSFIHKSVGEYLVAESVVQGDQRTPDNERIDRFYLFNHKNVDRWNNIIFLWAGLAPVADVEAFIESCNENNELSLAYGLLYDQYDRFSPAIKKKILLDLFKYKTLLSDNDQFTTLCSQQQNKKKLLESNLLRSVVSLVTPLELCVLLYKDKILTMDLINNVDTVIEKFLWYVIGRETKDLDEWKKVTNIKKPKDISKELFLIILADWAINKGENQNLYLEEIPELLNKPELIVLSAISNFSLLGSSSFQSSKNDIQNINTFIKIALKYKPSKMPSTWLKETLSWSYISASSAAKNHRSLGDISDLLKSAKHVLTEIIEVDKNVELINFDKYLSELIKERATL